MAKVPTKVVNWLYTVIQPHYLHKEIVYSDVYRFLAVHLTHGFRIRTAVYTSPSGRTSLLIELYGSVSCANGSVPVQIWIPQNYPFAEDSARFDPNGVPLVYVMPPQDMIIRLGNNVDLQGRFYHPYLSLWHQNYTPGPARNDFSLLLLVGCLKTTFEKEMPLALRPVTTGPALPPKPSRSETISPRRETTGPPLPRKPDIPLKYRAPPPLPQQDQTLSGQTTPDQNMRSRHNLPEKFMAEEYRTHEQGRPSERVAFENYRMEENKSKDSDNWRDSDNERVSDNRKDKDNASFVPHPHKTPEVEDLMDKISTEHSDGNVPRQVLEQIAQQINAVLADPVGVNHLVQEINGLSHKVEALHSQLLHHNMQAEANSKNLEGHVSYLRTQIQAITDLNRTLGELDVVNTEDPDRITTSLDPKVSVPLEELVSADLALVHQLYNVCADIKAHKDTINLVAGNFRSEAELISDSNMDACIKAVRNLAREAFWLEIERAEIGKAMGLQ